jgi:hypothetical protein
MQKKEAFLGRKSTKPRDPNLVSTKIPRKVQKKAGKLNELNRDHKMLCAIRKALASRSGLVETQCDRYYISGGEVYVTHRGGGVQTKKGEPTTYTARGRFKLGVAHADCVAYRIAEFNVTYKDTLDDRGLPDVAFVDPTTIDLLPKGASLTPSQAQ